MSISIVDHTYQHPGTFEREGGVGWRRTWFCQGNGAMSRIYFEESGAPPKHAIAMASAMANLAMMASILAQMERADELKTPKMPKTSPKSH